MMIVSVMQEGEKNLGNLGQSNLPRWNRVNLAAKYWGGGQWAVGPCLPPGFVITGDH